MNRRDFLFATLGLAVFLVSGLVLLIAVKSAPSQLPDPGTIRNLSPNHLLEDADYHEAYEVDKPACDVSLQSLVDAAAPESVVVAPGGCVYREMVVVDKPLTLEAAPGAEIRGSEIWTGWEKSGDHWLKGTVPSFFAGDGLKCTPGTERCLWPEQVFLDGKPLMQVASNPSSGQFAVDSERNVVLADDPDGHVVEVSVRRQWVAARADNVTIRGFTMRHAANARGLGAITNRHDGGLNYHSGWTIEDNVLSDAHAAVVALKGKDNKLIGNDISRGGQLGVHGTGRRILVKGNRIHDNNTEDFDPFWEAGGMKWAFNVIKLTVHNNEIYSNHGVGVWCDIECVHVTYSGNRVHHNSLAGLHLEISSGAKIFGNAVWENGWDDPSRSWNPGIKLASSSKVEVYGNTVAWNASGISVINAPRERARWNAMKDVHVHDNSILCTEDRPALSWIQTDGWMGGTMADPAANNRGANNEYWYDSPEGSVDRFRWTTNRLRTLEEFNATPGEDGGRYLDEAQAELITSSAGVPSSPEPH